MKKQSIQPTKILGSISTFTNAEQYLLVCHYNKCSINETIWRTTSNVFANIHMFYIILMSAASATTSILTQMYPDSQTVRDINTIITAIIGLTLGLTKTDTFNYQKLSEEAIIISDAFKDLATRINKNLISATPEPNAYHACMDAYNTMPTQEHKINTFVMLWAKYRYRNTDKRSLPSMLGGTHIILPDNSMSECTVNLDTLIENSSEPLLTNTTNSSTNSSTKLNSDSSSDSEKTDVIDEYRTSSKIKSLISQ